MAKRFSNRPVSRNSDAFGYNERSEVTGAIVSNIAAEYGYDEIGNSTSFTANSLNQYSQFQYDSDGNLLSDGTYSFTYDSANRLKTISTNGVLVLTNFYDAKSRRVKKVTPDATTTFFYDDWNLIEERVAYTNGTASTIKYYWGKDLSGSLQGAGGVGGLLYLTVDGVIYIPCYDNNGNITKYIDANGNTVAQYTYDAFGNIISKSGSLADFFRHRFSTKYFDIESGLYYYGYRFYHPTLMRWLNRDPIEEKGGLNLYGFCGNSFYKYDNLGNSYLCNCVKVINFQVRYKKAWYRYLGFPNSTPYYTIDILNDSSIPIRQKCDRAYMLELTIEPTSGRNTFINPLALGNNDDNPCKLLTNRRIRQNIGPPRNQLRYWPIVKFSVNGHSREVSLWQQYNNFQGEWGINSVAQQFLFLLPQKSLISIEVRIRELDSDNTDGDLMSSFGNNGTRKVSLE